MTTTRRFPFIAVLLALVTVLAAPAASTTAQERVPTLVAASLAGAAQGTVAIEGEGFTPGGVVRLVIHDLWGTGPTVEHWVMTTSSDLTETVAYLTASLYDQSALTGDASVILAPVTIHYMPPSEIDPAQGYASSNVVWVGGCPDLVVQAWDAQTDTWSNQIGIDLAGC